MMVERLKGILSLHKSDLTSGDQNDILCVGKEVNYLPAAEFLHLAVMCFWLPTDRDRMLN